MRCIYENSLNTICCCLLSIAVLLMPGMVFSADKPVGTDAKINELQTPLYSPFVERYMLDELKQIRIDMQAQRAELIEKVVNKELLVADRAMTYATNTITYFFYLIVGVSSLLVLVGWTSMRDIRQNVKSYADQEVLRITSLYETRLQTLEEELSKKSRRISETQKEIDRTNEIHSLWLKASQESSPQNKIVIYDQILEIRPDDTEALTYKADAVLLMNEPVWAINLCDRALGIDDQNAHAFYQRACANASLKNDEESLEDLRRAIALSSAFKESACKDESFRFLQRDERFKTLVS